ncbi:MAG: rhodanese-like domain-containing protein [Acholeplasmatales bacterium]|nr:MAG: rhodanese-like domain-containing protein [Acholeplasmatales bacterium]
MKKKLLALMMGMALLVLIGCDSSVTMKNIDNHLNQPGIDYIDLRSWDEVSQFGHIRGFDIIPFYETLEAQGILVRVGGSWTFHPEAIVDEAALRALFDETATLYIMCRTGNRSGFVVEALKHLGYTDVYNLGGIVDYQGTQRVFP